MVGLGAVPAMVQLISLGFLPESREFRSAVKGHTVLADAQLGFCFSATNLML